MQICVATELYILILGTVRRSHIKKGKKKLWLSINIGRLLSSGMLLWRCQLKMSSWTMYRVATRYRVQEDICGFQSASELFRLSYLPWLANFSADFCGYRGVTSAMALPHGRWSRCSRLEPLLFFQVAPHLSSWGWVDPVPDTLLIRKSISAGNRTCDLWVCSQELWPLERRGDKEDIQTELNIIYDLVTNFHNGENWCILSSPT
jgi:hypothetical protein